MRFPKTNITFPSLKLSQIQSQIRPSFKHSLNYTIAIRRKSFGCFVRQNQLDFSSVLYFNWCYSHRRIYLWTIEIWSIKRSEEKNLHQILISCFHPQTSNKSLSEFEKKHQIDFIGFMSGKAQYCWYHALGLLFYLNK